MPEPPPSLTDRGPGTSGRPVTDIATGPCCNHPRPQLARDGWWSLDGPWDFAIDHEARWSHPDDVVWDSTIVVPFAPETLASGIGDESFHSWCWYRRELEAETVSNGDRLVLRFGAVDYAASVWINGHLVARHEGGYTPFEVDVTRELTAPADHRPVEHRAADHRATEHSATEHRPADHRAADHRAADHRLEGTARAAHELVVLASDDPADLAKPRGKQDWEEVPHNIWYPRTTGIWQTVWMELRPRVAVTNLHWWCDLGRSEVSVEVRLGGAIEEGLRLRVRLSADGRELIDDLVGVNGKRVTRGFVLDGSGLDTLRDALAWTPAHPVLIDAVLEVVDAGGQLVDRVYSYTGLRTATVQAGRFLLNGRPFPLRLVLDQGYWPDSGLTPPDERALRRDVELAKAMGFNGVRKHQKIEDPRYLYWADRLGLLVWAELPPAYRFDDEAVRRSTREWTEAIERDRSHPSIVAWVTFNESTGVLSLPTQEAQRHYVKAMYHLTKAMDTTRPVISNDGWETIGGDIIGVHDYEQDGTVLANRYRGDLSEVLASFGNHGRLQTLDDATDAAGPTPTFPGRDVRPVVLSEFGGIGYNEQSPTIVRLQEEATHEVPGDRLAQPAAWGYSTVASPEAFIERYRQLLAGVHAGTRLAGFCYTQFCDTYQEVNGLLQADRTPKVPLQMLADATTGVAPGSTTRPVQQGLAGDRRGRDRRGSDWGPRPPVDAARS